MYGRRPSDHGRFVGGGSWPGFLDSSRSTTHWLAKHKHDCAARSTQHLGWARRGRGGCFTGAAGARARGQRPAASSQRCGGCACFCARAGRGCSSSELCTGRALQGAGSRDGGKRAQARRAEWTQTVSAPGGLWPASAEVSSAGPARWERGGGDASSSAPPPRLVGCCVWVRPEGACPRRPWRPDARARAAPSAGAPERLQSL